LDQRFLFLVKIILSIHSLHLAGFHDVTRAHAAKLSPNDMHSEGLGDTTTCEVPSFYGLDGFHNRASEATILLN
jgi:hypothetical protein